MRLLHTSDWHIGRQLHGVSLLEDQAHVLDQILNTVAEQAVDVVLISGDLYDRSVPPTEAVSLLNANLNRLCRELAVQVIVIAGNHDSAERLDFAADLLGDAGLHIIGPLTADIQPISLTVDDVTVDFFGLPYADPTRVRHVFGTELGSHEEAMALLLESVKSKQQPGRHNVVLSHCFIDGGEESDSERPLSIGGAERINADLFAPFTYSALGHLHRPQFKGQQHVRYSGSILKYSFSEVDHQKSVTLVDISAAGEVTTEYIELQPLRNMRILEGALEDILAAGASDPHSDDYVLARLTDTHAILDIIGKLRDVYPNTLHLERPGLQPQGGLPDAGREMMKQGELELFENFYAEVNGEPVTDAQRDIVSDILKDLLSAESSS
ncbi:MAG: exonuclease sbcCD subunit D [Gammaproteobacteria bacterium]|nr:MAG: exonuclease sbcCD subunit D [Gammaproteobacteria bacterium]